MSRWLHAALWGLLALGASSAGASNRPGQEPPSYALSGWVELAADGSVTSFEPAGERAPPESLRTAATALVEQTAFQPPIVDGQPQASRSWLEARIKLVPQGESYAATLDSPRLGPRLVQMDPRRLGAYTRSRTPINVVMSYTVTPEGKPTDIALENPGARLPGGAESAFMSWVRSMRFEPVQIAGEPVASPVRLPLCVGMLDAGHDDFEYEAPPRDPATPGAPGQTANDEPMCFTAVRRGSIQPGMR